MIQVYVIEQEKNNYLAGLANTCLIHLLGVISIIMDQVENLTWKIHGHGVIAQQASIGQSKHRIAGLGDAIMP